MPAYVIVDIEVRDPARYERYKELAPPAIAAHDGKYIARGGKVTVLEGDWDPKRCVILEFPSAAQAVKWWHSPEYAAARKAREECATANMIVVEGL
ncbi:MAG: DUF1330 domain-containing protein [Acidobacteriota bacterium]|nr:DUF1330 domain-containing protein [Acidobacteriota bacterium]